MGHRRSKQPEMNIRAHAVNVRRYLDHPEAEVYYYAGYTWEETEPDWVEGVVYRVIPPGYKELWEAYLDNELEIKNSGGWGAWPLDKDPEDAPHFDREEGHYRRKPESEVGHQLMVLTAGIKAVESLMSDTEGVAGLYRNGAVAKWSEVLKPWLSDFCDALDLVRSLE